MKSDLFSLLLNNYQRYHNNVIVINRFLHEHLIPLIKNLERHDVFQVDKAGESFEGRDIYRIEWGNGNKHILLWSQMHGDESTATRAMLDIWNFLKANDEFNDFREDLSGKVTLHFIPMLNPDGANRWERRTVQGIDMNRDAVRLQTPEAMILKQLRENFKPDFGFNLHDQSTYYGAGSKPFPATISFLAPAYNVKKDMNDVRSRAMKLIAYLHELLSDVIPDHIGRYDDTFNPRAFGDNFQKWGTSTVLIESGGYPNDPEKEYIRKLNFALLLESFSAIAGESFEQATVDNYEAIPLNIEDQFFDLLIRNAVCEKKGKSYKVDIGIRREPIATGNKGQYYWKGIISELGDLSQFHGYEEMDVNGLLVRGGQTYAHSELVFDDLESLNLEKIIRQGFTSIGLSSYNYRDPFTNYPMNIERTGTSEVELKVDQVANLIFLENKVVKETIVNGFLFESRKPNYGITNALVSNASEL